MRQEGQPAQRSFWSFPDDYPSPAQFVDRLPKIVDCFDELLVLLRHQTIANFESLVEERFKFLGGHRRGVRCRGIGLWNA